MVRSGWRTCSSDAAKGVSQRPPPSASAQPHSAATMSMHSARSVPLPAGLKILLAAQLLFVWVVLPLQLLPKPFLISLMV